MFIVSLVLFIYKNLNNYCLKIFVIIMYLVLENIFKNVKAKIWLFDASSESTSTIIIVAGVRVFLFG